MPAPAPFSSPHNQQTFPALYLYPLNDTFIPKHITLIGGQCAKIGRQTNAKTVPAERNGYFDSKVLSRQHAEIWEEGGKIYIKDVKSSNGTFINGERLSPEGVESDPFELKNDDIVEFGIDIIGEDNKTTIHHKVAARVMCVFTEEDVQIAARVEQMQNGNPSVAGVPSQQPPSSANQSFSFAQNQNGHAAAQRRPTLQSQGLGGMGGMGGSTRPPGKSGLTFDHILSRLQGELQKSRDTGAELHSLTNAMNDIHDTLGGSMPSNPPPYPQSLPAVRPAQLAITNESNPANDAAPSVSPSALSELRTQLHETQASLASHIDKVRALEDMLAEHEAIKSEVAALREMMDEQKRHAEHIAARSPTRHHKGHMHHTDFESEGDDDDSSSIRTVVPHELERVEEEDEDQLAAEEEDDEDRRRRRDELGRPRTPEPTGMGMSDDDDELPKSKRRRRSPTSRDTSSAAIEDLTQRLSMLAGQIEAALQSNNSLQEQHKSAQSTISLLESKISSLEALVQTTQAQVQAQTTANEAAQAQILETVTASATASAKQPEQDTERESLTQIVNEWKKSVEGQWSAVQEEWTHERERLSKAREEWEQKVKSLESGLDAKVSAGVASIVAMQAQIHHHPFMPNGDIKLNGTAGLVTPPSPVSVASNSGRTKSRRRRGSSSRGRSRSISPVSPIIGHATIEEPREVVSPSHLDSAHYDHDQDRSRSPSPSVADDSEVDSLSKSGLADSTTYPYTPAPSSVDSPGHPPPADHSVEVLSKTESSKPRFTEAQLTSVTTAVGVLVLGVAAAAVLWRVKPE
ncbi:hypothetical protein BJ138DRAFT_1155658 [Hygrophoropsis aurantiaca]|uniref:Uncharacterized protein n=1 Tax=Hygrophoropsis aurantiaca TaxID=72124 RepID=A0ACB8A986_9AGAM|nr:hypothetical protein BJ138DRAFT_1155658 [Hygrophoropsis aurantiaca]